MNTLIHADIFFFVSTILLVVLGVGIIVALFYIIKILRTVSEVSKKVKEESDGIIADVRALRGDIRSEGFKMKYVASFFKAMIGLRRKRKKAESETEE